MHQMSRFSLTLRMDKKGHILVIPIEIRDPSVFMKVRMKENKKKKKKTQQFY